MKSTLEQPLRFFEKFISSKAESFLVQEISDFVDFSGEYIVKIDYKKHKVHFLSVDNEGITSVKIYNAKRGLIKLLNSEVNISNDLINDSSVKSNEDEFNRLILSLKRTLNHIVRAEKIIIIQIPELLQPIIEIANYLDDKFLFNTKEKINLDLSYIKERISKSEYYTNNDEDLVLSTLGYLNGKNDKREKIMSDEQFELMIGYVNQFISTNVVPEIPVRISEINIPKNLLRFTFWVLHKHLYTTKYIKPEFVKLLKDVFESFDTWEYSTLRSKFGNRDKVTYQGVRFLPEIIKYELEN